MSFPTQIHDVKTESENLARIVLVADDTNFEAATVTLRRLSVRNFVLSALTAGLSLGSLSANAIIIDFEGEAGFAASDGAFFDIGEYRFTLTSVTNSFLAVIDQDNLIEPGTTKLFAANHSVLTFSRVDGGLFDLISLDIAGSWVDPSLWFRWADSVGISGGGNNAVANLLGAPASYQNVALNFLGVNSVTFSPTGTRSALDFEFIIDNLVVEAVSVPEPGTFSLLGAGLVGFFMMRRRRRTA